MKEQTEAFTNILSEGINKFVPIKNVVIREQDQSLVNLYTRLLLRNKNKNYQFFKKVKSKYMHALNTNLEADIVTRLKEKKNKALAKCKDSDSHLMPIEEPNKLFMTQ